MDLNSFKAFAFWGNMVEVLNKGSLLQDRTHFASSKVITKSMILKEYPKKLIQEIKWSKKCRGTGNIFW